MRMLKRFGAVAAAVGVAMALGVSAPASASANAESADETYSEASGQCPYGGGHPNVSRGLNEGSYSAVVKHAQCLWNVQNATGTMRILEDGYFGSSTQAAMFRIQSACGIRNDGVVGPDTWRCLHPDQNPNPGGVGWPIFI